MAPIFCPAEFFFRKITDLDLAQDFEQEINEEIPFGFDVRQLHLG